MAPHHDPRTGVRAVALALVLVALATACSPGLADDRAAEPRPATTDDASACTNVPSTVGTPVLRADVGGCTDVAAVLFTCAPRLDPVLVFLGSRDRAFLGGRFAVEVPAVPSDAELVGDAGEQRVYRERGVEGRVFVADATGVARWLALPRSAAVEPASVSVVGDSIAVASAERLVEALPEWSTSVDAVVGRTTDEGVPVVATATTDPDPSAVAASTDPSAVVVELGTNDVDAAIFASSARVILRDLADEALVVWVAPHAPFEITPEIRATLARLVARTSNAVVADWSAAVPSDALAPDGVHLLPERVDVFADFLAGYLRTWRMAVAGQGATSCVTGLRSGA